MSRWARALFLLLPLAVAGALGVPATSRAFQGPDADRPLQTPPAPGPDDRDGDGVPSDVERELDTDPDVPGLFPGSAPHIPEPLNFDLVRGLGAKRGEFEFNVLAKAVLPFDGIAWAPEVEWAFAERHAIEFELPMENGQLHAVKMALQGTFREMRPKFIHGWQFIGEGILAGAGEFTGLYIAGRRFGRRTSALALIGPRLRVDADGLAGELVLNPSLFVDLGERFTIGLENNAVVAGRQTTWRGLPQFHVQLGRHFRVQLGAGVEVSGDGVKPTAALRLIVE